MTRPMTANALAVLLHYYVHTDDVPERLLDRVARVLDDLRAKGLIVRNGLPTAWHTGDDTKPRYSITEKGTAHVKHLLAQPLPTLQYSHAFITTPPQGV